MHRRRLLALVGSGSTATVAGCGSGDDGTETAALSDATTTDTESQTPARGDTTATTTTTATSTTTSTTTEPRRPYERATIFVGPDGDEDAPGSETDPLGSIQHALEHAGPGDTVRLLPGDYPEAVRTQRSGEPDAPITLTGPPEAVFRGNPDAEGPKSWLHIEHSHIHLRGITFDGLSDPASPDRKESYVESLITARHTPASPDHYHRNLVIKPHAVGNTLRPLIHVMYSEGVDIGEFEVTGPAGLAMLKFGDTESHAGEIVYLGTSPDTIPLPGEGPDRLKQFEYEPDLTNDVHVHHIDNSVGHPHAELVDMKDGCHDVLVEYCTDAGGAGRYTLPSNNPTSETSISVGGRENTVRWNRVENSNGQGIEVGSWGVAHQEEFAETKRRPYPEELTDHGRANEIYGNRIADCAGLAVQYPLVYPEDGRPYIAEGYGPDAQTRVCGNTVDGATHGSPESACAGSVQMPGTIGHRGGDSPWE